MKLQKNKLHLINVESWHEAVFQCVVENDQGMNVTSSWVQVEGSLSFRIISAHCTVVRSAVQTNAHVLQFKPVLNGHPWGMAN